MREIINCFFHCIEPTDEGYTYHFAVPTDQGIGVRKVSVGFVETQPIFAHTPLPRDLKEKGREIWRWFAQQTDTKII